MKWPANPLERQSRFREGRLERRRQGSLFWYKFRLTEEGKGVLSFKQDVYHMFDFMGTGAEQVIAHGGTSLLIYGHRDAKSKPSKRGEDYNYKKIANHTHY